MSFVGDFSEYKDMYVKLKQLQHAKILIVSIESSDKFRKSSESGYLCLQ